MSAQHDHDEEDCPLCRGTGEVSISKDGTYEGTDYYGCPMCISRERDEEIRLIKSQTARQPLTDDELDLILQKSPIKANYADLTALVRAVEKVHGIGGEA